VYMYVNANQADTFQWSTLFCSVISVLQDGSC